MAKSLEEILNQLDGVAPSAVASTLKSGAKKS